MKNRSNLISNKGGLFMLLLILKKHFLFNFKEYYKGVFLLNFRLTIIFIDNRKLYKSTSYLM